jgi:outer membrane protein assembly factor BamB
VTLPSAPAAHGAIDAERVYLPVISTREGDGADEPRILALARSTGAEAWRSDEVATISPLLVSGTSLFAGAADTISDVDVATGRTRRRITLPGKLTGPLALAGPLLLAPTEPDRLVGLRSATGETVWTSALGAPATVAAAIDEGRDVAYVALSDGRLTALSLATGTQIWTTTLGGVPGPPIVARDRVLVGSSNNTLYARNVANGRHAWAWTTGGDIAGVVVDDETVYAVSLDNTVRALRRGSGNQQWLTAMTTRPVAAPALVDTQLLVAGVSPILVAFDATTGKPAATFALEGDLRTAVLAGAPIVAPDMHRTPGASVVLVMRDGRVVALRPGAPETLPSDAREAPDATGNR